MEHKKFFVKDFILYASPCFGCGQPMSLRLMYRNKAVHVVKTSEEPWGSINATITDHHVVIDLSIKYGSTLKLWIVPKTNQFLTNDNAAFSNYIVKFDMRLAADCKCGTRYETNNLDFQTFNMVVGATTLSYEFINLTEKDKEYILYSNFTDEKTTAHVKNNTSSILTFNLPFLPRYKLRNRQHLVDKLKLYCLFS